MSAIGRFEDGKGICLQLPDGTELTLEEADSWENGEDLTLAVTRVSISRVT